MATGSRGRHRLGHGSIALESPPGITIVESRGIPERARAGPAAPLRGGRQQLSRPDPESLDAFHCLRDPHIDCLEPVVGHHVDGTGLGVRRPGHENRRVSLVDAFDQQSELPAVLDPCQHDLHVGRCARARHLSAQRGNQAVARKVRKYRAFQPADEVLRDGGARRAPPGSRPAPRRRWQASCAPSGRLV